MAGDEGFWRDLYWQQADEFRSWPRRPDTLALVRNALAHDRRIDWRTLAAVSRYDQDSIVDPEVVAAFTLAYTTGRPPLRVLDPWAGLGVTLSALDAESRLASGVAYEINEAVHGLARELSRSQRMEWRLGDAALLLRESQSEYDLVVGSPPIGLPTAHLALAEPQLDLRASATYTMLIQAARHVAPDGEMVVVLPEAFFGPANAKVRAALAEVGMHPAASLALSPSAFATTVPLSVVVLTRAKRDVLFTAQLDPAADVTAIVANLREGRDAKLPQLGRLVATPRFVSWHATLVAEEISSSARTMGLRSVPVAEICGDIRGPRRGDPAFSGDPEAIYLPKLGTSPAVRSLDALVIKPHNYLQLILRPDVADPEYVATFLSSPLGLKVREQLASGTTIPQISIASLSAGSIPLPPTLEHQRAAVLTARRLAEIRQSVEGLQRDLWDHPLQAGRVEGELRTLLEGDGLERWMESLPFPLASVLWRYHAEEDVERKVAYLVHFFEGATVFLVDVLLSGLQGDPTTLADVVKTGGIGEAYSRGSIGIWADLLSRLARRTRDLRSKAPALTRELFRIVDLGRIDGVANKSVVAALKDEAAQYRRDWIGHAAVVGTGEWRRRLALAEETLARVRSGLADSFDGWELVRAGRGGNRGGVITASIERLVGSHSLFRKTTVELREWPEEHDLYLIEDGASLALHLNRLFTLQRSPESVEDACYFYDRIEADGIRWISYHYEPQPEVVRPDPLVAALIEELNRLG